MFNFNSHYNNFIDFLNSTTRRIKNNYLYYFAMPDKSDLEYNLRTGRGHPRGIVIAKLYTFGNFLSYQFSFTGMRANYSWMKSTCSSGYKKVGGGYNFLYEKTSTFLNYQFSFIGMRAKYNWMKSKFHVGAKKIGGGSNFLYENFRTKILRLKPVKYLTFEEVIAKGRQLPQPPVMTNSPEVSPLRTLENIKKPHYISTTLRNNLPGSFQFKLDEYKGYPQLFGRTALTKGTTSLWDNTAFLNLPRTKPDNGYILTIPDTSETSYKELLDSINESMEFLNKNHETITKNKTLLSTKTLKGKPELDLINQILQQSQERIDKLKLYRGIAAANLQAKIDRIENSHINPGLYTDVSKIMEPIGPTAERINGNLFKKNYITCLNKKFNLLQQEAEYSERLFKEAPNLLEKLAVSKVVLDPKLITGLEKHSKSLNPLQGGLARLLLQKRAINSQEWFNRVYQAYQVETNNPDLTEEEFSEIFNKVCHHKLDTEEILPNLIHVRNSALRDATWNITRSYQKIKHIIRGLDENAHLLAYFTEKKNIWNNIVNVMENNERIQIGFNFDYTYDLFSDNEIKKEQYMTARILKVVYLLEFKFSEIDTKIQTEIQTLLSDQEDLIEYAKNSHGHHEYFYLPERDKYPSLVSLPDDDVIKPMLLEKNLKFDLWDEANESDDSLVHTNAGSFKDPDNRAPFDYKDYREAKLIASGVSKSSSTAASTDANNEYIEKVLPFEEALVERINLDLPASQKINLLSDLPSTRTEKGYQLIDETSCGIPYQYLVTYEQYAYYQNYLNYRQGQLNNMITIPESSGRGEVRPRKFELEEIDEEIDEETDEEIYQSSWQKPRYSAFFYEEGEPTAHDITYSDNIDNARESYTTDSDGNIRVVARKIHYIEENARLRPNWAESYEYQSEMTELTQSPEYVAQYLNKAYTTMDSENLELVELATQLARLNTEDLVSQLPYKQVEKTLRFLRNAPNFLPIQRNLDTYLEYYYPTKIPGIGGVCDTVVYHDFKYPYPHGMDQGKVNQLIEKDILTDFAHYKKNCKTRLLCDLLLPLQYLEKARSNTYNEIKVDRDGNLNRPLIFDTRDNNLQPLREYSQQLLAEIKELTEKDFNIEEMHHAREAYMSKLCLNQVVEKLPSIVLSEINPTRFDQETVDVSEAIDVHNLNPYNHVQIPEFGFKRLSSSYEELTPIPSGASSSRYNGETSVAAANVSSRVSPQIVSLHTPPFNEIERVRLVNEDLVTIASNELRYDLFQQKSYEAHTPPRELEASASLRAFLRKLNDVQKLIRDRGNDQSFSDNKLNTILDNLRTHINNEFIPRLNDYLNQQLDNEFLQKLDPEFFVNREQEFQKFQRALFVEISNQIKKDVTASTNSFDIDTIIQRIKTYLNDLQKRECNFLQNKANDLRLEAVAKGTMFQKVLEERGKALVPLQDEWIHTIINECESINFELKTTTTLPQKKQRKVQDQIFKAIDSVYTHTNSRVSDLRTRYTIANLHHSTNTTFQAFKSYSGDQLLTLQAKSAIYLEATRKTYMAAVDKISEDAVFSTEVPFMPENRELMVLWKEVHKAWLAYTTFDMLLMIKRGQPITEMVAFMEKKFWEEAEDKAFAWCEQCKVALDSAFLYKLMDTQPLSLRLPWFQRLYEEIGHRESLDEDQKRLRLFKEKLKYQSELESKTSTDVLRQTEDNRAPNVSISDTKTKDIINSSEIPSGESTVILLPETVKLDDVKDPSKLVSTGETINAPKFVLPSKEAIEKAIVTAVEEGKPLQEVYDTLFHKPLPAESKTIFDTLDPENLYPLPAERTPRSAEGKSVKTVKTSYGTLFAKPISSEGTSGAKESMGSDATRRTSKSVAQSDPINEKQDYSLTPAETLTAYLLAQDCTRPLPVVSLNLESIFGKDAALANIDAFSPGSTLGFIDILLKRFYLTDKKKQQALPANIIQKLEDRWSSLTQVHQTTITRMVTQWIKDFTDTNHDLTEIRTKKCDFLSQVEEKREFKVGLENDIAALQNAILKMVLHAEALAMHTDTEAGVAAYSACTDELNALRTMHTGAINDRTTIHKEICLLERELRMCDDAAKEIFTLYCNQVLDDYETAFQFFDEILDSYSVWISTFKELNVHLATKLTDLQAKQQIITTYLKLFKPIVTDPNVTPEEKEYFCEAIERAQKKLDYITAEYLKLFSERDVDFVEQAELLDHLALLELWPILNPFHENNINNMIPEADFTELKEEFGEYDVKFNSYVKKFPDHFRSVSLPASSCDISDPVEYKLYVEPVNPQSLWSTTVDFNKQVGSVDDNENNDPGTAKFLWSMMAEFDKTISSVDDNENNDLIAKIDSLADEIYNLEINVLTETADGFNVHSQVMDALETLDKIEYSSLLTGPKLSFFSTVLSEYAKNRVVQFIKKYNLDSDPTIPSKLNDIILRMKSLRQYSNEFDWDLTKVASYGENPEPHLDAYLYGGENQLLADYLDDIGNNLTHKTGLYHKKYLLPQNLEVLPAQDRLEFIKYNLGYNPFAASVLFNPILNKVPIKLLTALQLGKSVRMSPAPGCISYSHVRYFLELQTNLLRPEIMLNLLDFQLFSLTAPDTVTPPMAYGAVLRKMTKILAETPVKFVFTFYDDPIIHQLVNHHFRTIIETPRWGQEDSYRILFDILNSRRVNPKIKIKVLNFLIEEPHLHFSVQLQIIAGYHKFLLKELSKLYFDSSNEIFALSQNFYKQLTSQLVYKNKSALITVDSFREKSYLSQAAQVINVKVDEPLYRLYFSQLTPTRDEFFGTKHIQLNPKLHVYFFKCHEKINQLSDLIIIPLSKIVQDTSNISRVMVNFLKQSYASQSSLLSHFNLIEKVQTFITDIKRGFNDSQTRSTSPNETIPETQLNLTKPVALSQTDLNVPKPDLSTLEPINELPNPFKKSQLDFSEKDTIPYITIESYKILPRPNRRIDPFPFRGRKGKVIDYLNFRIKLLDLKKLLNPMTYGEITTVRPLLETPGSIINLKLLNISIFMKDLGAFLGLDVSFLDANPNTEMCNASKLDIPLLKGKIQELPDSEELTETRIYDLLLRQNLAPQVKPHLIKYNEILVYNRFNEFLGSQLKICRDNFLLANYIKIEDKSPYLDLPLAQLAAHVLIRVNDGLIYTFRFLGIKDNLTQITIFTDKSYLSFIHFIRTENNLVNKKGFYLIPETISNIIKGFEQLPSYTNKFNLFVTTKPKPKYLRILKQSFVRNKTKCYFIKEYKLNSAYKTNHDIYLITGDKKPIQVFTNLSSYNEYLNPALRSLLQFDFGYIKLADLHPGSGINSKFVSNINYKINVDKSLSMSSKIGFFVTFQNSTNQNISVIFADPFKQFSDFSSTYGFFIRQKIRQSIYQYFKLTELRSNKFLLQQTFLQKDQKFLTQFINLPYWFNYIWLDDQMKLIARWVYAYRQRELVLKISRQLYKTLKSYNILGTIYAAPSQKINPLTPVSFKERFRYFLLQKYMSYPHRASKGFFQKKDSRLAPGFARQNIVHTYLKKQFEYASFKRDTGLLNGTQNLLLETGELVTFNPNDPLDSSEKTIVLPSFVKFKKIAKNNFIRELDNYIFKVEESISQLLGNPLVSKLSQTSSYLKTMVFKLINSFHQLRLKLNDLNSPFAREVSEFSLYSSGQEIFKFMLSIYNVVDLKVFDLDSRLFSNMLLILLPVYRLVVKKVGNQLVQGNFTLKKFINKLNVNKEKFSFDTVDYGYKSRLPYWNDHYATNLVQYFWSKSNQSKIKPLLCSNPHETVTFSTGLVLPLSQVYRHASILQLQQCGNKYATFFNIRAIKFQLTELMFFLFKSIEKFVGSGLNLNLPNLNYIARIAILDSKNFNGGMILWHIQHNSLYCELFTPTSRTRKKIKLNRLSQAVPSRHVDKVYHCGTKIRYDTDIQSHGDTKQIIFRFKNTNHLTIGQFAKFDKFKEIDDLYEILKKEKLNLADTLKKVKLFEFKNPNVTQFMTKRKKQKMEYLIYMAYPNVSGIKVKSPVKSIFDNGLDWKIPKIQGTHIPILLRPANHIRSTIGDFVEPNDQIEPLKIPSSEQKNKKLMDNQTKEVILSLKGKGVMAQVYETISDFIKSELFSWITFQEFREELLRQQNDITPYGIMSQCISALTQGLLSGFMLFAADFRRAPNTKKSARLLLCKVIIFSGLITVGAFCLIHYGGVDLLAELFKLSKWFFGRQRIPQPVITPIQLNSTLDDYDTSIFLTPYYAVRKSNWGIIETVGNFVEASKKMLKVVRDIDIDNLDF